MANARAEADDAVAKAKGAADGIIAEGNAEARNTLARSQADADERLQRLQQQLAALREEAETRLREIRADTEAVWSERRELLDDHPRDGEPPRRVGHCRGRPLPKPGARRAWTCASAPARESPRCTARGVAAKGASYPG
jgi:vacuolar-type H+-ATPase subunit H